MKHVILFLLAFFVLAAAALAATQNAIISWTDLPNETSYTVERKIGPTGVYAPISTTGANVVTFTDVNLAQGTNFCWRVTGMNTVGTGLPSDDACMSTTGVPGKVGGVNVIIQIVP